MPTKAMMKWTHKKGCMLLWLWLSSLIVVIGAHINVIWSHRETPAAA